VSDTLYAEVEGVVAAQDQEGILRDEGYEIDESGDQVDCKVSAASPDALIQARLSGIVFKGKLDRFKGFLFSRLVSPLSCCLECSTCQQRASANHAGLFDATIGRDGGLNFHFPVELVLPR
jgi:hypothetical protein